MRTFSFLFAAACGATILMSQGCAPTCESVCARQEVECANVLGDTCVDECNATDDVSARKRCQDELDALVECMNASPNICMPSCDSETEAYGACIGALETDTRGFDAGIVGSDAGTTGSDAGATGSDAGATGSDAGATGSDAGF
jgi:hypothetical protein